jgi:hypothetical protein
MMCGAGILAASKFSEKSFTGTLSNNAKISPMLCKVGAELARAFDDAGQDVVGAKAGMSDSQVPLLRRQERLADATIRHKHLGSSVLTHKMNCPDCGSLASEARRRQQAPSKKE